MEKEDSNKTKDARMVEDELLNGFSPVSSTRIFWKSRKGSIMIVNHYLPLHTVEREAKIMALTFRGRGRVSQRNLDMVTEDSVTETPNKQKKSSNDEKMLDQNLAPELSERRKALFEPLEPVTDINGKRSSAESLLPPPDFDATSYPKGWLIGKKRKLVIVDVVESMRRIAVQEMNRKDREISGLNEQLEEDARCLEHLQLQLLQGPVHETS
ncbi:hypothetical protein SADUNF_Sadunf01G0030900 [Salix dunnii]|uniref:Uncharacterized protein n=1 Tax=Salix dunnii TaxID=1413687 RepID=A0A835N9A8_9ROSI|nr:hypothetical protein SADUNF_Sadunf01G0030900 [Salix dunnii]